MASPPGKTEDTTSPPASSPPAIATSNPPPAGLSDPTTLSSLTGANTSFTTCADSTADVTFYSCINESMVEPEDRFLGSPECHTGDVSAGMSDLERTILSSTPNKANFRDAMTKSQFSGMMSTEEDPLHQSVELESSLEHSEELEINRNASSTSPSSPLQVLQTQSSIEVIDSSSSASNRYTESSASNRSDYAPTQDPDASSIDLLQSSSSVHVIGSKHDIRVSAPIDNNPEHKETPSDRSPDGDFYSADTQPDFSSSENQGLEDQRLIKVRNSHSNTSMRSSVSSIAVLGSSSQSLELNLEGSVDPPQQGNSTDDAIDDLDDQDSVEKVSEDLHDEDLVFPREDIIAPTDSSPSHDDMTCSQVTLDTIASQDTAVYPGSPRSLPEIGEERLPSAERVQSQGEITCQELCTTSLPSHSEDLSTCEPDSSESDQPVGRDEVRSEEAGSSHTEVTSNTLSSDVDSEQPSRIDVTEIISDETIHGSVSSSKETSSERDVIRADSLGNRRDSQRLEPSEGATDTEGPGHAVEPNYEDAQAIIEEIIQEVTQAKVFIPNISPDSQVESPIDEARGEVSAESADLHGSESEKPELFVPNVSPTLEDILPDLAADIVPGVSPLSEGITGPELRNDHVPAGISPPSSVSNEVTNEVKHDILHDNETSEIPKIQPSVINNDFQMPPKKTEHPQCTETATSDNEVHPLEVKLSEVESPLLDKEEFLDGKTRAIVGSVPESKRMGGPLAGVPTASEICETPPKTTLIGSEAGEDSFRNEKPDVVSEIEKRNISPGIVRTGLLPESVPSENVSTEVLHETDSVEVPPESAAVASENETAEIISETAEVAPETAKVAPESAEVAPETAEILSETAEVLLENAEVAPETAEVAPETAELLPETAEVAPETAEVLPEAAEVAPETTEVLPDTAEVAPETGEVTSPPRNMYPEVVIKPTLQIRPSDLDMLKMAQPIEYTSPVESTPDIPQAAMEMSFESETVSMQTVIPSHRTASLTSAMSVPESVGISEDHQASDLFVSRIAGIMPREDVVYITKKQKYMLNKLECTNEKLRSCNNLSAAQFEKTAENFRYYTKLLLEMRRDVDMAFRRIHSIKGKLSASYPEVWERMSREAGTDWVHPDQEERESGPQQSRPNRTSTDEESTKTYIIADDTITEVN